MYHYTNISQYHGNDPYYYNKWKYQRTLELHPDYFKQYRVRILEINPDFYKRQYQRILEIYPDYNKRRYQRYKEHYKQYYQRNRDKILARSRLRSYFMKKGFLNKHVKIHKCLDLSLRS